MEDKVWSADVSFEGEVMHLPMCEFLTYSGRDIAYAMMPNGQKFPVEKKFGWKVWTLDPTRAVKPINGDENKIYIPKHESGPQGSEGYGPRTRTY